MLRDANRLGLFSLDNEIRWGLRRNRWDLNRVVLEVTILIIK